LSSSITDAPVASPRDVLLAAAKSLQATDAIDRADADPSSQAKSHRGKRGMNEHFRTRSIGRSRADEARPGLRTIRSVGSFRLALPIDVLPRRDAFSERNRSFSMSNGRQHYVKSNVQRRAQSNEVRPGQPSSPCDLISAELAFGLVSCCSHDRGDLGRTERRAGRKVPKILES